MTAISPTTCAAIKAYLEVFIENLIEEYRGYEPPGLEKPDDYLAQESPRGRMKPFHAAIIPAALLRINAFERGFSSRLGTTFEECARLIALEHHKEVHRGYDLTSEMSQAAIAEVERQVAHFERVSQSGNPTPTLEEMIDAVLAARGEDDLVARTVRADLHLVAGDGAEFFFEMKSPMPNKGQCLEVTQRLLRFHLARGQKRPAVYAYFAMAYNPYGPAREDYGWSFAKLYTPFEQAVVIGHEFWEVVGGRTAFEELLAIYQEVGHDKSKYMLDALAFGF